MFFLQLDKCPDQMLLLQVFDAAVFGSSLVNKTLVPSHCAERSSNPVLMERWVSRTSSTENSTAANSGCEVGRKISQLMRCHRPRLSSQRCCHHRGACDGRCVALLFQEPKQSIDKDKYESSSEPELEPKHHDLDTWLTCCYAMVSWH